MKTIQKLKTIRSEEQKTLEELKEEILKYINAAYIEEISSKLDDSKDLTCVENDEFLHVWVRIDKTKLADIDLDDEDQVIALKEVLFDHDRIELDLKNDCVTRSIGPCIIMGHERGKRHAYDQESRKIISDLDSDTNDIEFYAEIENWMDRVGYFPSVVSEDGHGNYFFVNTKVGEK